MARELNADPRLIAEAYRQLELEGLVELRARSGIYIRADAPSVRRTSVPAPALLVNMLVEASIHGHSAPSLVNALQLAVTARALRTAVITTTSDQGLGLVRELREDFGLDAVAILADRLKGDGIPESVKRSQLLVTTKAHAGIVGALAERFSRPHIVISMRMDLFENEWRLWRGERVHIIVLDPRFRAMLINYIRENAGDPDLLQVHLATGNLSRISDDAPTYITQAARAHLGRNKIPGTAIPPTRLLEEDCIRAIWRIVTQLNLQAAERKISV